MNQKTKENGDSAAGVSDFREQRFELSHLVVRQPSEQNPFGFLAHALASFTRLPPGDRECRQARAAVLRIRQSRHQPVCFQAINQLRDVRFHT